MDRFVITRKVSVWGIIGNLFLLILKSLIGLYSHSQAMIADAFNSASDILSSLMTYVGNKVASKKADDDHNLGHGKAEYIYSMLISIVMILLSFKILGSSFDSLFNKGEYHFSYWLIVVCIITIVVKLILYLVTKSVGKKYHNLLVEANSKDHRNDCIITLFNMLSAILSLFKIEYIDGIVGIGISLWIIYTGIQIFKESYDVLMDKTISDKTKEEVMEIIKGYKEIHKVTHFNATPVGYQYMVSFSIFVDGNMSTFDSHEIANKLEKEIGKKIEEIYLTVIHVNPWDCQEDKK